jgi:hypothetical protein
MSGARIVQWYNVGLRAESSGGSTPGKGWKFFFSPPDRLWGHPVLYPMGTGGSFLEVKWPGREADHSLPPSAEIKNA